MDYETNRLRPYEDGAKLLTVALSSARGTFAFPFEHKQAKWTEEQLDRVYTYFINFLHKANCRKVVHQLAFEMEWSAVFFGKSILRCKPWGDSVTQAFVLDERMKMGKPDALSLEFLTVQYFGLNLKHLSDIDRLDLDNEPLDQVLTYNNLDAKYHRLLYIEQAARIKKEDLLTVYHNQLHRVPTMVLTQMKGLPVDQVRVMEFKKFYESIISRVEEEIADQPIIAQYKSLKGAKFRPSANEDVLFLVRKVIKQGIKNVDEKSLADVHHPVIPLLIEHRKASKNLSTYVKPVMPGSPCLFPDGKLHPIISTTRTRTSRTASDSPNVQNWPKRKNKKIRSQIRGKLNQKIVSFDYGQIQARNVAMESLDKALVKAFWDRYDIHADWVERIVKKYPAWVPGGVKFLKDPDVFKALRNKAKNEFVFPSFFGAQAKSLSRYLGVPVEITERLHDDFWEMFPEIKDWQKGLIKTYFKTGYVTGLSGFRRRAPISPNELINAPIQADECLIVCDAMTRLSKYDEPRFQASMEIHDDLTFIWEQQEIEKNAEVAIREMLTCPYDWINVPIVVEMSIGDDWSNGKEVAHFASDLWEGKDPFKGTWADGTGWANAKGMEKARGSK
jgi:DNA polymerase I-like protein with 3'-5' exonuclease and polymerase domains